MKANLCLTLGLMVGLSGCEFKTLSNVRMTGNVESKVRTEIASVVDLGPMLEVPVGPGTSGTDGKPCLANKVAVIDVDGLLSNVNHTGPYSLGENPLAMFKERLDAAAADPAVKAVVLRINTFGGGVAASDLMYHELLQFKATCHKPVVACLLDVGCGGGYYLAAGCDAIVGLPTGVVGGLGVLLNLYDIATGMKLLPVTDMSIRSGDLVDMGSPARLLKGPEEALLKEMAHGYHKRLIEVVCKARPKVQADAEFFDGRVMTGTAAMTVGLLDSVGYLDDAVNLACQLSKTESAVAVMYRRAGDAARSLYANTPNRPIHPSTFPMSLPGIERSKIPLFLYMWQVEPGYARLSGT
jgi:protease IV